MYYTLHYISQFTKGGQCSNRGSCADYNANNSWYFNGTNRCLNNNNRYNGNFRSRPLLDSNQEYDNELLNQYAIPLKYFVNINRMYEVGKHSKPAYIYFYTKPIATLIDCCHEVNQFAIGEHPAISDVFVIHEPCTRMIIAAPYGRKLIHTLYVTMLRPYFETKHFHPSSFSCRKGMGALAAVNRVSELSQYFTNFWYAKVDLKSFFMSIDCNMIVRMYGEFINKHLANHPFKDLLLYMTRVLYLDDVRSHYRMLAQPFEISLVKKDKNLLEKPYYFGVPIGNWPSQISGNFITTFALNYLEALGYQFAHYTDDTVVIVRDKDKWLQDIGRLEMFYKNQLGLALHPHKRYLQHCSKGVEFLGKKIRHDRILPSNRIYHNMIWKLQCYHRKAAARRKYAFAVREKYMMVVNSYIAILRRCNGFKLRKRILEMVSSSAFAWMFDIDFEQDEKIVLKRQYTKSHIYKIKARKTRKTLKKLSLC